jgi:hypothetical protein
MFVIGAPFLYFDGSVTAHAAHQCPSSTFLSGGAHGQSHWAAVLLVVMIALLAWQALLRLRRPEDRNLGDMTALGKLGLSIMVGFTIAAGAAYWIDSTSRFCLTPDGIYQRDWPWRDFQHREWSTVSAIAVECWERKGPDLYYTLAFRDGTELDIGEAIPRWKPSVELQHYLARIPLQSAEIYSSCSEGYPDWVRKKP